MSWNAIQDCKDLFHEILGFLFLGEIMDRIDVCISWRKQTVGCRVWGSNRTLRYMKNIYKIYSFRYMSLNYGWNADIRELRTTFAELKTLVLNPHDKIVVNPGSLPKSITHLELNREFAVMPIPGSFHSGLVRLEFHNCVNHSLKNLLPDTLTYLYTGMSFNQPIEPGTLPQSLTHLEFGIFFDQKLYAGSLPNKLRKLIFGRHFSAEIDENVLPDSLIELYFILYNHRFRPGVLPRSLKVLSVGSEWNQPILPGDLPTELTELYLTDRISRPAFGQFNKPILPNALPNSITCLVMGWSFQHVINADVLPESLKILIMLSSGHEVNLLPKWNCWSRDNCGTLYSTQTQEYLESCKILGGMGRLNQFLPCDIGPSRAL
jgi:FNIP Repeat